MANATTPSTKPVQVYRLRGISASVFRNTAKTADRETPYFKVSLQRTYKDGDSYKTTSSLSRDDLPVAAKVLTDAWAYILGAESRRTDDNGA